MIKTFNGPNDSDSKIIFKNKFTTICPHCKKTIELPPGNSTCSNCHREIAMSITFIYY